MKHPDSDTILKYALETLGPDEHAGVAGHMASCAECQKALGDVLRDIDLISGLMPDTGDAVLPSRAKPRFMLIPVFRAAAILIAGFLAGYYYSGGARTSPVTVTGQLLEPVPALTAGNDFTSCDVIDIASR